MYKKGYFKAPDFIFDLDLDSNAKLIFLYLCRRSNKVGESFPSLNLIGRDCGIKSRGTVLNGLKQLEKTELIRKHNRSKIRKSNTYTLSEDILRIIKEKNLKRPVQNLDRRCSKNGQEPVQNLNTKEYTYKEYTRNEQKDCVLNNSQVEELSKFWFSTYYAANGKESSESPEKVLGSLLLIANQVSKKLPDVFKHTRGILKWYTEADGDSDPSRGNEWVYKGDRKSSRLAQNFEVVWSDYWLVNAPVEEWQTPKHWKTGEGNVSEQTLRKAINSLQFYRKYKDSKKSKIQ